jgi:hypothetical protein
MVWLTRFLLLKYFLISISAGKPYKSAKIQGVDAISLGIARVWYVSKLSRLLSIPAVPHVALRVMPGQKPVQEEWKTKKPEGTYPSGFPPATYIS